MKRLVAVIVAFQVLHFAGWVVRHGVGLPDGVLHSALLRVSLEGEGTLPAWFASGLLLVIALVAADLARSAPRASGLGRYWWLLALTFAYLSLDESLGLHENLSDVSRALLGDDGILHYGWFVIALPFVAAFGLVMVRWLLALPRRTSLRVLVAGACYVGGAIGFEIVGNLLLSGGSSPDSLAVAATAACEEIGELFGASLFLCTLVEYSRSRPKELVAAENPAAVSEVA